jgi:hypothetical protein
MSRSVGSSTAPRSSVDPRAASVALLPQRLGKAAMSQSDRKAEREASRETASASQDVIRCIFLGLEPLAVIAHFCGVTPETAIAEKSVTDFVYTFESAGFPYAGLYNPCAEGRSVQLRSSP